MYHTDEFVLFLKLLEYFSLLVGQLYYIAFFALNNFLKLSSNCYRIPALFSFASFFFDILVFIPLLMMLIMMMMIVFVARLTYKQSEVVFPEETIVRNPHHRDFPTRRRGTQS